jgi:putative lipase involved disintegration of autophagic bodies
LVKTISELEKKAAEESVDNEVFQKLGDIVRKKESIERKLSTTYSLGRDRTNSKSKSMLPLQIGKPKSYSFQGAKKQKLKMFHTLSDTSSDSSTEEETNMFEAIDSSAKDKGKTPMVEVASNSSNDEYFRNPLDVT